MNVKAAVVLGCAMLTSSLVWAQAERADSADKANKQSPTAWSEDRILSEVGRVRAGRKLTPKSWPGGARVAVCLSFDVDNETLSLRRGETAPVALSAGEYGATSALPRILALLSREDLPASFFIPAVAATLHPEMIPAIRESERHEIGVHGWIHENLHALDDEAEERRLLRQSLDYLTEQLGKQPVGFRAPSWAFSRHTLPLILEFRFAYDSSMMAMDEPYELLSDSRPTGLVELPVDWILDDYPYYGPTAGGSLPSPAAVTEIYREEFDRAYREGTMLMLTFHPHIVGHRSRIAELERLVRYMKSKPGVWFATAEDIAEYVRSSAKLK